MKILVVDDHALIRDALQRVMKKLKRGVIVLEASDGHQAMEVLGREPDLRLVLLDLNLPDRDGFLVLADIRERYPAIAVVVLSALQDRAKVMHALELGAAGYIPKSVRREVMISALQLVFAGGVYIPPEVLTREDTAHALPISSGRDRAIGSCSEIGLSERQLEVLALLMQGKSNKVICRTLQLAEPTVKNHVTAILKALKVTNRTEAAIAVNGFHAAKNLAMPVLPPTATPLAEFFQIMPNERPPRRADRTVGGLIPARALRYCEALTTASAFGWYVFLPLSFKVVWDGHDMLWTYEGIDEWLTLSRNGVQYPGFDERFDTIAPPDLRGCLPPFLTPSLQAGGLQVWTGTIAETAPGWSLLVRGVANLSHSPSYQMLEGIIETDHWFGPLFDNIRLLKTDVPIEFRSDVPFLQVQPVRKDVYGDKHLRNFIVRDLNDLSADHWDAYRRTLVLPNTTSDRKSGQYAVTARKQVTHASAFASASE